MRNLKHIALTLALFAAKPALAYVTCAGETFGGKVVTVTVETTGTMAAPNRGEVTMMETDGQVSAYELKHEEIVQFFESDDSHKAIVGLAAYQNLNNPIWIKYVGENYEGDLIKVLRDPNRKKQNGNEMRVWRGPGFGPDQQSQFTDVVCSISLDV
ncbi:MAG: hypothetical protein JSU04_16465 [Bdellovibrionales bacterium]|nr:hypothetical protein [Bdellovibrionales bacterium]